MDLHGAADGVPRYTLPASLSVARWTAEFYNWMDGPYQLHLLQMIINLNKRRACESIFWVNWRGGVVLVLLYRIRCFSFGIPADIAASWVNWTLLINVSGFFWVKSEPPLYPVERTKPDESEFFWKSSGCRFRNQKQLLIFIECTKYYPRLLAKPARFRTLGQLGIATYLIEMAKSVTEAGSITIQLDNASVSASSKVVGVEEFSLAFGDEIPWIQITVNLKIVMANLILVKYLSGRC